MRNASRYLLALFAALFVGSCGPDSTDRSGGTVVVLSPATLVDTVGNVNLVTFQVLDGSGAPVAEEQVFLTAEYDPLSGDPAVSFPEASAVPGTIMNWTVDGVFDAIIDLGSKSGVATIRVQVSAIDLDTLIHYTILPGPPVAAKVTPGDTVLVPGGTGTFVVHALDSYGNKRPMAGTVTLLDPGPAFDAGSQTMTGGALGVYRLIGAAEGFVDTIAVSVVPSFFVAAIDTSHNGILRRRLDGTIRSTITGSTALSSLAIGLSGNTSLVYRRANQAHAIPIGGGTESTMDTWDLVGQPGWMMATRDSAWIYSETYFGSSPFVGLARFRPDGSNEQFIQVPEFTAPPGNKIPTAKPSPSRDGTRVAYVRGDGAAFIRVFAIGDSASAWMVSGQVPAWSPVGDTIAYVEEFTGPIHLLDPNTGNTTQLTPTGTNYVLPRPVWSMDGLYVLARQASGPWCLIRVSDGLTLPLPTLDDLAEMVILP